MTERGLLADGGHRLTAILDELRGFAGEHHDALVKALGSALRRLDDDVSFQHFEAGRLAHEGATEQASAQRIEADELAEDARLLRAIAMLLDGQLQVPVAVAARRPIDLRARQPLASPTNT